MNEMVVLIIEDDIHIKRLISTTLIASGYKVLLAKDGKEAILEATTHNPDIILLDLGLPDMDGIEIIEKIRSWTETPIIVISARSDDKDKIEALDKGADDYLTKPFSLKILFARIEAVLRRHGEASETSPSLLQVDRLAREVSVGGAAVALTYTEFELLEYLMTNKGLALSRDKILNSVWRYDYEGDARTVDTHIKMLRSHLKEYRDCIETVWGVGYKFEVKE